MISRLTHLCQYKELAWYFLFGRLIAVWKEKFYFSYGQRVMMSHMQQFILGYIIKISTAIGVPLWQTEFFSV